MRMCLEKTYTETIAMAMSGELKPGHWYRCCNGKEHMKIKPTYSDDGEYLHYEVVVVNDMNSSRIELCPDYRTRRFK